MANPIAIWMYELYFRDPLNRSKFGDDNRTNRSCNKWHWLGRQITDKCWNRKLWHRQVQSNWLLIRIDHRRFLWNWGSSARKETHVCHLFDAVECFQEYAEQDRLFNDAEDWILEDDYEWPFSFINICEAVDMNPKYLRKGLLHWRQSAIPQANTVLNKGSDKRGAKTCLTHWWSRLTRVAAQNSTNTNMGF